MSRVARSARVASRQRVETIDASSADASKTITKAETGELYFIDATNNVVITLPPLQEGAYFKFIVSAAVGGGKSIIINSDTANVCIDGSCLQHVDNDNGTADLTISTSDGDDQDKITLGAGTLEGSYVELHCDGSKWLAIGMAITGTILFGDQ
tara:strand:+ start:214 stop:672 length:459 start_codon:yes stop_codon:yes gene_type:complete